MKKTLGTLGVVGLLLVAGGPVGAHGDGSEDPIPTDDHEDENVVAANAAGHSNAPDRFAPCINGMAADTYPCDGVDMLGHLSLHDLGVSFVNEIWGWTDSLTGVDHALVGAAEGMVIVDVGDPKRPDVVGMLPGRAFPIILRDIKVYADHAFIVSEASGHGMQVFDLTQLRDVDSHHPVVFEETAHYDGNGSAHNVAINEDTGYAYIVGAAPADGAPPIGLPVIPGTEDSCNGGLHMVDISEPTAPEFAGCFSDHGYIHDAHCVIYHGPDAAYQGREI